MKFDESRTAEFLDAHTEKDSPEKAIVVAAIALQGAKLALAISLGNHLLSDHFFIVRKTFDTLEEVLQKVLCETPTDFKLFSASSDALTKDMFDLANEKYS